MFEKQRKGFIIRYGSFIEAYWRLTPAERQLVLLIARMIQKNDDAFNLCKFGIRDFDKAGIKDCEVRELIGSMVEKALIIRKRACRYLHISWIASAEYSDREGYELCIDPKLKPYLLRLKKQLSHYQLAIRLESFYSIRLYEFLSHDLLEKKQSDLKRLRQIFMLKASEYRLYGDFKKRILIPSQKEIYEKTGIASDFTEIKEGKSVTAILFGMRSAIQSEAQDKDTPDVLLNLIPEAYREDMGIVLKVFANCDRHGAAYVRRNIEYANNHHPTNNYGMFLEKALREDLGKG